VPDVAAQRKRDKTCFLFRPAAVYLHGTLDCMKWLWVIGLAWSVIGVTPAGGAQASTADFDLVPPTVLAFDANVKECDAQSGQTNAFYTFWVTNVCETNVLILDVASSCGCTVAQLPSRPWVLPPGENGPIKVTMDLRGRYGTLFKGLHLTTSAGVKALVLRANVPEPKKASQAVTVLTNGSSTNIQPPAHPPRPAWDWKPHGASVKR
jgi:hypothetical protein